MSLFNQITGMLGNDTLQKMMNGNANVQDPNSAEHGQFQQMVRGMPQDELASVLSQSAGQVDAGEYQEHVTPGAGGTDPLGSVGQGGLSAIAGALLSHLGGSGGAGGGGGLGSVMGMIPGLSHEDPNRMNASEVASLAKWTRENRPDAFGRAAAQVGQQDPGLLQKLLGNKALMSAAAGLASKFFANRGH